MLVEGLLTKPSGWIIWLSCGAEKSAEQKQARSSSHLAQTIFALRYSRNVAGPHAELGQHDASRTTATVYLSTGRRVDLLLNLDVPTVAREI